MFIYIGGGFIDEKALGFPNIGKQISGFNGEETIAVQKLKGSLTNKAPTVIVKRIV